MATDKWVLRTSLRAYQAFSEPGRAEGPTRASGSGETGRSPDLHTQLEALLDQVWRSEADWRLNDRIDLAVRLARMPG